MLLSVNMIANINRYKLWRKEKWPTLLFHISFIMIVIGAGITRYVSFEGMMSIREGEQSNPIVSDRTFTDKIMITFSTVMMFVITQL